MPLLIGEYAGSENLLERSTFRAFFYEDSQVRNRSFTVEELERHIADRTAKGEPTQQLEIALSRLRRMNA